MLEIRKWYENIRKVACRDFSNCIHTGLSKDRVRAVKSIFESIPILKIYSVLIVQEEANLAN